MSQNSPQCDCGPGQTCECSHDIGCPMRTLMGAALEMFEALTESLRWIAKVAADHDDDPHLSGQALRAHDKVRAAIRKATGG